MVARMMQRCSSREFKSGIMPAHGKTSLSLRGLPSTVGWPLSRGRGERKEK
jgi:hypothetical protein